MISSRKRLAWRALPREAGRRDGFDWRGALCSVAMLAGLFIGLDGVGHGAPAWQVATWLSVSLLSAVLFLQRQRRARHPLLPLSLFAERRFTLAVTASGLAFVGQGLAFVALSFLYQQEMGFTPLETAWMFTPWPLAIMLVGPVAGQLADKVNPSLLSSAGLVVLLLGFAALAGLQADAGVLDSLWRTALCGLGFGLFQPPNNREMMASVPEARSARASGVMSTTRTVGQALGVALVGGFLASGAPVQATLWAGAGACVLSLAASVGRISSAGRAQHRARRAAPRQRASSQRD